MATIPGTEASEVLNGGSGSDSISGLGGDDSLYGQSGNDTVRGGLGSDTITGGVGNDIIFGDEGDDVFAPHILDGHGNDRYEGGDGNDSFLDPIGRDTLIGGAGNDRFLVEVVQLTGSNVSEGAASIATGGAGRDVYYFGPALAQGQGTESGGVDYTITDFKTGTGGDQIDIEALLFASADSENFSPYQGGNPFHSTQGYVRLLQSGADTLLQHDLGGKGEPDEFVTLLTIRNRNAGAFTADNFVGGINPKGGLQVPGEVVTGSGGDETLQGGFFNDTVQGDAGNDSLDGSGGNDVIDAGSGDDTIRGGPGNDTMQGGEGNDTFIVTTAGKNSVATGGEGVDTYVVEPAKNGRGFIVTDFVGGPGGDTIDLYALIMKSSQPAPFNDELSNPYTGGNPFDPTVGLLRLVDDTLGGATHVQWDFDGPTGTSYDFKTVITLQGVAPDSLTPDNFVGGIPPDGSTAAGGSFVGTIEADSLRGGLGDDEITGDEADDHLRGWAGADNIDGGNGDDTLLGGQGDDFMTGGAGSDTFEWIGGEPGVDHHVDQLGDDTLFGGEGSDGLADFWGNNWIDGEDDSDHFIVLSHDDGASTITGGDGIDMFSLGTVRNSKNHVILDFVAGFGGDLLDVEQLLGAAGYTEGNPFQLGFLELRQMGDDTAGLDTAVYWDRDGKAGPRAKLKLVTLKDVITSEITSDNFFGQHVIGTTGNDDLQGGLGNDTVEGLAGNDTLNGSLGADTLEGGSGNDVYIVDHVDDEVVEDSNELPGGLVLGGSRAGLAGNGITDSVRAAIDYALGNFVENLTLTGTALTGTGNELANVIKGNSRNNLLDGGDGNDRLDGSSGKDTLDGGVGSDTLIGGTGDDALIWGEGDRYDGNSGVDTLHVTSGNLDLTAVTNSRVLSIEVIDLTDGEEGTVLTLVRNDVIDMSPTDVLKILGDPGDQLNAAGFGRISDLDGFHRYKNGVAILLVDTDIAVS